MNKIFKLKKSASGLKVVSEIAKGHSGERAVVGGGFGSVGSAFFARLGLKGDTSHGSFSFGKVALSLAAAVALSPFMVSQAEALVLCRAGSGALVLSDTCYPYTTVTTDSIGFNGGVASGGNSVAWNGAIAGERAVAWNGAIAGIGSTAFGEGATAGGMKVTGNNNNPTFNNVELRRYTTEELQNMGVTDLSQQYWYLGYTDNNGNFVKLLAHSADSANATWVKYNPASDGNSYRVLTGSYDRALQQAMNYIDYNNKGTVTAYENSVAFGANSKALATNAFAAMGGRALKDNSIALGVNSIANGANSFATVGGVVNTDNSIAIGKDSIASGKDSVAILGGKTHNQYTFAAMGGDATGYTSIAIGRNSSTSKMGNIAIGGAVWNNETESDHVDYKVKINEKVITTLQIPGPKANGTGAIALGARALADSSGEGNIAIGYLAIAKDLANDDAGQSVAIGTQSKAIAGQTIAIGANVVANGYGSIAIGGDDIGSAASSTKSVELNKYISFLGGENAVSERTLLLKAVFSGACEIQNGKLKNPAGKTTCSDLDLVDKEGIYKSTNASALGTLAIGQSSEANNTFSNAVGFSNIAGGVASNALGVSNIADANGAGAYGLENKIHDANSTGIGILNTVNLGAANSTAIGVANKMVAGDFSTAIGAQNEVTGPKAISVGSNNLNDGNYTLTVGDENTAIGPYAAAVGVENNATNTAAFAVGGYNQTEGAYSTALGFNNLIEGNHSMAFGEKNIITAEENAVAIGMKNRASSNDTIAMGIENVVSGYHSLALGSDNTVISDKYDEHFGGYSVAIGSNNDIYGPSSFIAGSDNWIDSEDGYSFVGGFENIVENSHSIALGVQNYTSEENATAIGRYNSITGANSIAVGYGHQISGSNSGAFGDPTYIDANNSYAIGNNNNIAAGNDSVFILGNNVTNTYENSVFLGDGAAYVVSGPSTAGDEDYDTNGVKIGNIEAGTLTFAGSKPIGVVSIGNATAPRRIQNVAAGLISKDSTDAVNGSQLYYAIEKSTVYSDDRLVFLNNEKNITSPYLHINGVNSHPLTNYAKAIGTDAIAIGKNSEANKTNAVAIGNGSKAGGENSVALMGTKVTGNRAMAWGDAGNQATNWRSTAWGKSTTASGQQATAFGEGTEATKDNSTAWGKNTHAVQNQATAFGADTTASGYRATAWGQGTEASGSDATAFGVSTKATKNHTTAFGKDTVANADGSTAWGQSTNAGSIFEFVDKNGEKHTVTPVRRVIERDDGLLKEVWVLLKQDGSIVKTGEIIGQHQQEEDYAAATNDETYALNYGKLIAKLTPVKGGNDQTYSTAFGEQTIASGQDSTAFGFRSVATGWSSTAWGHETAALGKRATAFGTETWASGNQATAFGFRSEATNENTTAWGSNTKATGTGATAWGSHTKASGDNSTAWGKNSEVYSGSLTYEGKSYTDISIQFELKTENAQNGETYTYTYTDDEGNIQTVTKPVQVQYGTYYVQGRNEAGKLVTIEKKDEWEWIYSGEFDQAHREIVKEWIRNNGGNTAGDYSTAFGDSSKVYAENALGALGGIVEIGGINSAAIGKDANVSVADTIALGSGSKANRDNITGGRFYKGYDIGTDTNSTNNTEMLDDATWVATANAIAVGDADNNITRQITGVAAGSEDTDAVNVAQLKRAVRSSVEANATTVESANGSVGVVESQVNGHKHYDLNITDTINSIVTSIGGETKVDDDNKTIITNNIGDTGKNTIHEAIKAVDKNITVNGWNEANTTDGNLQLVWSDTNNTYDLSLNKDLNLTDGSITFGDSYIKNGEFVVANDGNKTTITPNGLVVNSDGKTLKFTDNNVSVGGNQIHDVAKGTADDDAVNVAQLKEANTTVTSNNGSVGVVRTTKTDGHTNYDLNITDSLENIASIIGGETKYDGNKTIITNNIGDTGKNTIHEAIKAVDKNITVNGW
ncbi:hypothetical protein OFO25_07985, partial [Campylobacter sp. CS_ED2]|nr:hypothetical protein [Campylobacter sp. CS_ED2]